MNEYTTGPVEFMLFGFEGNYFDGSISVALADLVDDGLIRIIDLAVISKDAAGNASILEMQELTPEVGEAMIALTGDISGLLSEADLMEIADSLEPNTTTAALLYESIFARRLADSIRRAKGELIMSERIPGDVVEAARQTLITVARA